MYQDIVPQRKDILAHIKEDQIEEGMSRNPFGGRLLLKGGRVIDPRNHRDEIIDIAICGDRIYQIENEIIPEKGDCVVDCDDLMVIPGIIDMHLHLGDLFEVRTYCMCCSGRRNKWIISRGRKYFHGTSPFGSRSRPGVTYKFRNFFGSTSSAWY